METKARRSELLETEIRELFNITFGWLDDCRCAGTVYTGDNGCYILRYLYVTKEERKRITTYWKEVYGVKRVYVVRRKNDLDIELC